MKKVLLILVALFSFLTIQAKEVELDNKVIVCNMQSLSRTLQLSKDQVEIVSEIQSELKENIKESLEKEDNNQLLKNTFNNNLKHMKWILNPKQYRLYNRILQATIVNKGYKL